MTRTPLPGSRGDARRSLEQAQASLHAAAATVHSDPDAAMDDILAARLLVGLVLLSMDSKPDETA